MISLLKRLFSLHQGFHATVTVQDEESNIQTFSYLNRMVLWLICAGALIGVIIIVALLLKFSPLESVLFNHQKMRKSVLAIQHKVALLEDTLEARNTQLRDMKRIMLGSADTVLTASEITSQSNNGTDLPKSHHKKKGVPANKKVILSQKMMLPSNAKLIENLFKKKPDFPAPYPVEGTLTRGFNINTGHYGIDIATGEGATFKAVADGVIVSEEWTFNYGYVVIVQHTNGILTVFKHVKTLRKATGQIVRAGDVLGTVGNVGILSTGPHLHFEIWKNGIPQDAQLYLLGSGLNAK